MGAAIPVTSVLDDFNRANNASLGANWTTVWGGSSPKIASNLVQVSGASAFNAVRWNVASFGPDCEVFVDLGTFPSSATLGLYVRSDNVNNAYECDITTTGITLKKTVATVQSTLTSNGTTFAGGDSVYFSAVGSLLSVYKKTGGAWGSTPALTFTDTSVTASGSIAFFVFDTGTTFTIDNFGGGLYSAVAMPSVVGAPVAAQRASRW